MVANKKVTYAGWKYRPDVEVTLESILTPIELKVKKKVIKNINLVCMSIIAGNPQMAGQS